MNSDTPKPIKIFRIGKYDAGKSRRVKVCYETTGPAKLLLRNKDKLPKDIKIFSDQTPAQHKYLQELKDELSRRQANGESDIIIKYINGTPAITKTAPKNYQQ